MGGWLSFLWNPFGGKPKRIIILGLGKWNSLLGGLKNVHYFLLQMPLER
jgi:hypothetical protein